MKVFAMTTLYQTAPNNVKTNNVKVPASKKKGHKSSKVTILKPNAQGELVVVGVGPVRAPKNSLLLDAQASKDAQFTRL